MCELLHVVSQCIYLGYVFGVFFHITAALGYFILMFQVPNFHKIFGPTYSDVRNNLGKTLKILT